MMPDAAFWRGKRVFLTGHTGFKGAWAALWLHRLGAQVHGLALTPEEPSLCSLVGLGRLVVSQHADIREPGAVLRAIEGFAPDIVIHMAAQALVRRSYAEPALTFDTNVMGTINLLEAVRQCSSVKACLIVTSDKCYENREWIWGYRESEALGGHDPYSSSKAAAEIATAAWRRSFFSIPGAARIASARAGNVIGGGDFSPDRLIPDCVRAFSRKENVRLRYPGAIRPWQHVLDPLSGYLLLCERLAGDEGGVADAFNFGPDDGAARTVRAVAEAFAAFWGQNATVHVEAALQPHEAHSLKLDSAKARAMLGWRPRLAFEDALAWTARWYRAWVDGEDVAALTAAQIEAYMNLPGSP